MISTQKAKKVTNFVLKIKKMKLARPRHFRNIRSMSRERRSKFALMPHAMSLRKVLLSLQPSRPKKRRIKRKRGDSQDFAYETECSPEQLKIFMSAQKKVMLAKLARFSGFVSPKALRSKLHQNRTEDFQLADIDHNTTNFSNYLTPNAYLPNISVNRQIKTPLTNGFTSNHFRSTKIQCKLHFHY
jgi:hypothetical protein